ncbi:MAG: NAD(+) synthase [Owenweeksia sp.]
MKTSQVIDHIVNWLKNYLQDSGQKGFVIGVSGGIDSAVTSKLLALTGLPVLCVEMPIHQNQDQVSRALKHIKGLQKEHTNVSMTSVDLSRVFDLFIDELPQVTDSDERAMSLVNSRARLRMTTLYYFAALNRYIVAGTGNKVEDFGVGFYTKYGDGGVDISPIADLLKTEVYAVGKELGIISEIMQAPPTDGLWGDDRSDEDQIGASYPELEWAMKQKEMHKKPGDFEGREREVYEIYLHQNRINQHKMLPIPVCEIPSKLKD